MKGEFLSFVERKNPSHFQNIVLASGTNNVHFRPFVPQRRVAEKMPKADHPQQNIANDHQKADKES